MHSLIENLDRLHTTPLGAVRVKRNLSLQTDDIVPWCKEAALPESETGK